MRLAVIIALLTLSVSVTAQSFRARIIDSETGKPVLSASIQYNETGNISDSSGIFTIDNPKYPIIISISHINYHPRDLVVQSPQESGMDIEIIPKTIAIDVIEIVGERVKRFFEKQYFYISDYLILDKNILLIGYEKGRMSKGVIAMTNYSENAFVTSYIDNPKSLFRDVFGQVFLFANDSVYQVFFDGDNFNLLFPQLAGNFPQEMFKIQCMLDEDNCVMKEAYENRQLHKYRKFNFVTQKFTDIANIYDKSTFKSVAGAANHRPATGAWDLDAWINELYQNRYIYKPVISESFAFQDGLIIFDLSIDGVEQNQLVSIGGGAFIPTSLPIPLRAVAPALLDQIGSPPYIPGQDLGYFIWQDDETGNLLFDRLLRAADRGVRVRLLVDDIWLAANDKVIAAISMHPNFDIKIFNPGYTRHAVAGTLEFLANFKQLNRRMHNKLFIVPSFITS